MEEEHPIFLVDAMLGTLARWLRILGYDAEYAGDAPDREIVRRSRAEGRIILTRDRELAFHRKGVRTIFIQSEDLGAQWRQLRDDLGLSYDVTGSRCPECNVPLEPLSREEAKPLVPPYVYETQKEFKRCPRCGRVYWRATHWEKMNSHLRKILGAER